MTKRVDVRTRTHELRRLQRIADAAQALIETYEVRATRHYEVVLAIPKPVFDSLLDALDTEATDG